MCAFGVDGTITGSYNTGVVSGEGCVGGVCGTGSSVTITDSYNTGSVSGMMMSEACSDMVKIVR